MKQIIIAFVILTIGLVSCSKENEVDHPIVGSWDYLDDYYYQFDSVGYAFSKGEMWLVFSKDGYMSAAGPALLSVSVKYSVKGDKLKMYYDQNSGKYTEADIKLLTRDSLTLERQDSIHGKVRTRYSKRVL